MKRYIKANSNLPNYKDFWVYKELVNLGYTIKVKTAKPKNVIKDNDPDYDFSYTSIKITVAIYFEDGDLYTKFEIFEIEDSDGRGYLIYDGSDIINGEVDYDETLNECICSCLYYFYTRY